MEERGNLKLRSFKFSLEIIDLLERLPKNYIYAIIGKQLLRSATSVGANIAEAQGGITKKDFINRYHIALKSLNETKYWLAILNKKTKIEKVGVLLEEAIEIGKILGASLVTLKKS